MIEKSLYYSVKKKICRMIYEDIYRDGDSIPPERKLSEELGVSRQGVHDNITRAEAHLQKMEAKTGCVRRYLQSRTAMETILDSVAALVNHADPEVRQIAGKIADAARSIEE